MTTGQYQCQCSAGLLSDGTMSEVWKAAHKAKLSTHKPEVIRKTSRHPQLSANNTSRTVN